MTELIAKIEQGTYYSSAEGDCTNSDCCSETKSVDYSVIKALRPTTGDERVVMSSKDYLGSEDLNDICDHIESSLLLFQSSMDLFSDVRGIGEPKSEQGEVSHPIKNELTKAETTVDKTPKETPKPKAYQIKKKSCLKAEQGTCSTDGDVTAEFSLTSGWAESALDLSGNTVNRPPFQGCNPEDDVQADDRSVVKFSEVTVRNFACRLGDNPSTRSGAPITMSRKPLNATTVEINKYEMFVGRNRRKGNALLISPLDRSKMLVEEGYELEEIAKIVIETEHGRQDRSESIEKYQRWKKIRSVLSLTPSSFDSLVHGEQMSSPLVV